METKTALSDLIQWSIENAFNIEGQDGIKYVALDYEEMCLNFDDWIQKEETAKRDFAMQEAIGFTEWTAEEYIEGTAILPELLR